MRGYGARVGCGCGGAVGLGVAVGCAVAVGSAVAVGCDVAVGSTVVVGSTVDVGTLVAETGVCACGVRGAVEAGIGHCVASDEFGEVAPGSQPLAMASSKNRLSAASVTSAPQPAPNPNTRESRPATTARWVACLRRIAGQRGMMGCVVCCDQCDPGGALPHRRTASSCRQTVFSEARPAPVIVGLFPSLTRIAPSGSALYAHLCWNPCNPRARLVSANQRGFFATSR